MFLARTLFLFKVAETICTNMFFEYKTLSFVTTMPHSFRRVFFVAMRTTIIHKLFFFNILNWILCFFPRAFLDQFFFSGVQNILHVLFSILDAHRALLGNLVYKTQTRIKKFRWFFVFALPCYTNSHVV